MELTAAVWKDLHFETWKALIRQLCPNPNAIYQFVVFASRFLAMNVTAVVHADPSLHPAGRGFVVERFPKGGPEPGSAWLTERLLEFGVDVWAMWRRLADEGAPMKLSPSELAARQASEGG
jgi:hypothetical protein